ncbi:MAG: hypothetical protein Q8K78_06610 [Planctomycetaceae bacterium]|nr:hypothetical protein [Planctomycetaceae bacterium]
MFRFVLMGLAVLAASLASSAQAFTFKVDHRLESKAGVVKRASLGGAYTLASGEVLDRVQFTYNGGLAQGKSTANPPQWSAALGAFDLTTYRVDFTVRNVRTGRRMVYSTQTYTWGK